MRSLQDMEAVLKTAKLDTNELTTQSHAISFAENLNLDKYQLLELPSECLEDVKAGKGLTIKGYKNDSAVLCTESKTFDLKMVSTSNSMLLFETDVLPRKQKPDHQGGLEIRDIHETSVVGVVHDYNELKHMRPKLKRLADLLQQNPFMGVDKEDPSKPLYRLDELNSMVQASLSEIHSELERSHVFFYQGYYRLIDFDLTHSILTDVLEQIDSSDIDYDAIQPDQIIDLVIAENQSYPRELVAHTLNRFSSGPLNGELRCLNDDAICRFIGELILRSCNKMHLEEFMKAWCVAVPASMNTSLSQLSGCALVNKSSSPPTIRYFPCDELSEDLSERFAQLFDAKLKWTLDEISPYLQPVTVGKITVGVILIKYARTCTDEKGQKYFTCR